MAGDRRGDERGPGEKVVLFALSRDAKSGTWRFTMRRAYGLATAVVLLVSSSVAALGQAPAPAKTAGEDVAATVSILDHVWLDAAHNGDDATLEWLFADNFVEIHPGGLIASKQQQIDQIKNPQGPSLELHPDNIKVLYSSPDVAVIMDTTTIRGKSGDVTYDGPHRVIRVFAKQHGRWRAAGAGIVKIAAQ
jgi:ketosteroid isomerase-like protein